MATSNSVENEYSENPEEFMLDGSQLTTDNEASNCTKDDSQVNKETRKQRQTRSNHFVDPWHSRKLTARCFAAISLR